MSEQTQLARNIKKHRQLMKLTQTQLAQLLFVTPQNISKWETGKSVPDLDNLCKMAKLFSVSTDHLLGRTAPAIEGRLLIAIDGGGTKTEFVLFTEFGEILERVQLGGSNPNSVGLESAKNILKSGLDQLLFSHGEVCCVFAGIAGCGIAANQKHLNSFFKKTYPGIRFSLSSDIMNVINTAPSQERCIAVICGTGSVVFAQTPEKLYQIGGWGYLWDSWCSGYTLGKDAIGAALSARERTGPQTVLRELVETKLGGDVWEQVPEIYRMPPEGIASFSPIVFEAYRQKDAVAAGILHRNAEALAKWINTAAALYDCGTQVVLAGGLTAQQALWEPILADKLTSGLELIFSQVPQICGAALGACRMMDIHNPQFPEIFYQNYQRIREEDKNAEN